MFKIQLMEFSNWSIRDGRLFDALGCTTHRLMKTMSLQFQKRSAPDRQACRALQQASFNGKGGRIVLCRSSTGNDNTR
jgi:hypothetical protein